MEFWEWMNQKYIEWRGSGRGTISEFADFIGVRQSVMSSWMKRGGKNPGRANLAKIASKLGPEVYIILKLSPPSFIATLSQTFPNMSHSVRERLAGALSEYNARAEDIPEGDPRLDEILKDALKQNGFKL